MTHEEIKILISAYFDGAVNPSEKNIVEEHLKECPTCQKDYKMYKAMSSSLSKWSNETLSPDEEIKVQKRFEQRREPMFTKRTAMALGTTLALTLIIGSVVQTYVKHGVQGRLRSSVDDMGDQYSDANTLQRQAGVSGAASYFAQPTAMKAAKGFGYQPYYMQKNYNVARAPIFAGNAFMANQLKATGFPVRGAMVDQLASVDSAASVEASPKYAEEKRIFMNAQQAPMFPGPIPVLQEREYSANITNGPVQINYDRKIIKNADITLKVQSAQNTQSILESLVGKYNGTVNSLNMYKLDDGSRRGVMVISVPPQSLDNVLTEIRKLGEVDSENQAGSDVTNQYTYLQARLASYESERERLEKVLKKSANDVDNNIYVQGQITNVEENMNGIQSGLQELDKQSFMATVTVNFYDTVQIVAPKEESLKDKTIATLKNDIKNTLETCYYIAVNSFSGIVIVLSFLIQLGLWALLFWGIYLIVRRFFK